MSNLGLIAVTALVTLGVIAVIISAVWLTYLARTQQGKHDAMVSAMNGWFKDITNHFNQKHQQLTDDVKTAIGEVNGAIANVKGQVDNAVKTGEDKVTTLEQKAASEIKQAESKL